VSLKHFFRARMNFFPYPVNGDGRFHHSEARMETRKSEKTNEDPVSGGKTISMTVEESVHASSYEKTTSETVIPGKNIPIEIEKEKALVPTEDPTAAGEIVSSQTITSRSRTVETTTYSLEKEDGDKETRLGRANEDEKMTLFIAELSKKW